MANHAENAEESTRGLELVTYAVAPNNTMNKDYAGWWAFSQ